MVPGIRPAAVTGSFYPENRDELLKTLDKYYCKTVAINNKPLKALIVPHAGYDYSGQTAAWGFKQFSNSNFQFSKRNSNPNFVLIGPSHNYFLEGVVGCSFKSWQTPLGSTKQLPPVKTADYVSVQNDPFIPEHCLEVQLPFLQYMIKSDFSFSGFLTGPTVDYLKAVNYFGENYNQSVFIISSDLSHYLPFAEAEKTDRRTIDAIIKGDIDYIMEKDNVACGAMGIAIIMEMARKQNWRSELIRYDTSATASGDKLRVVGYTAIGFYL